MNCGTQSAGQRKNRPYKKRAVFSLCCINNTLDNILTFCYNTMVVLITVITKGGLTMSMILDFLPQGELISIKRKEKGLTQKELGIKLGCNPKSAAVRVAQYEDMKRIPKKDTVIAIAAVLGCAIEEIGYKPTIGERIKIQREMANVSLEQLSDKTGYSVDMIKQYEEDKKTPKYTVVCCIAALLDISPLKLYGIENKESQDEEIVLKLQLEIDRLEKTISSKEKEIEKQNRTMQNLIDKDERLISDLENENIELKTILKNISKQILSKIKE